MILWGREIYYELQTTDIQSIRKNFSVKEGKKLGPEITYGRTHSYVSPAFKLWRFHCILSLSTYFKLFYVSDSIFRVYTAQTRAVQPVGIVQWSYAIITFPFRFMYSTLLDIIRLACKYSGLGK